MESVAPVANHKSIGDIVPDEERRAYDMHRVLDALVDEGSFFELKPLWARELLIGFARIDGESVGIVANNPMHLGGGFKNGGFVFAESGALNWTQFGDWLKAAAKTTKSPVLLVQANADVPMADLTDILAQELW